MSSKSSTSTPKEASPAAAEDDADFATISNIAGDEWKVRSGVTPQEFAKQWREQRCRGYVEEAGKRGIQEVVPGNPGSNLDANSSSDDAKVSDASASSSSAWSQNHSSKNHSVSGARESGSIMQDDGERPKKMRKCDDLNDNGNKSETVNSNTTITGSDENRDGNIGNLTSSHSDVINANSTAETADATASDSEQPNPHAASDEIPQSLVPFMSDDEASISEFSAVDMREALHILRTPLSLLEFIDCENTDNSISAEDGSTRFFEAGKKYWIVVATRRDFQQVVANAKKLPAPDTVRRELLYPSNVYTPREPHPHDLIMSVLGEGLCELRTAAAYKEWLWQELDGLVDGLSDGAYLLRPESDSDALDFHDMENWEIMEKAQRAAYIDEVGRQSIKFTLHGEKKDVRNVSKLGENCHDCYALEFDEAFGSHEKPTRERYLALEKQILWGLFAHVPNSSFYEACFTEGSWIGWGEGFETLHLNAEGNIRTNPLNDSNVTPDTWREPFTQLSPSLPRIIETFNSSASNLRSLSLDQYALPLDDIVKVVQALSKEHSLKDFYLGRGEYGRHFPGGPVNGYGSEALNIWSEHKGPGGPDHEFYRQINPEWVAPETRPLTEALVSLVSHPEQHSALLSLTLTDCLWTEQVTEVLQALSNNTILQRLHIDCRDIGPMREWLHNSNLLQRCLRSRLPVQEPLVAAIAQLLNSYRNTGDAGRGSRLRDITLIGCLQFFALAEMLEAVEYPIVAGHSQRRLHIECVYYDYERQGYYDTKVEWLLAVPGVGPKPNGEPWPSQEVYGQRVLAAVEKNYASENPLLLSLKNMRLADGVTETINNILRQHPAFPPMSSTIFGFRDQPEKEEFDGLDLYSLTDDYEVYDYERLWWNRLPDQWADCYTSLCSRRLA